LKKYDAIIYLSGFSSIATKFTIVITNPKFNKLTGKMSVTVKITGTNNFVNLLNFAYVLVTINTEYYFGPEYVISDYIFAGLAVIDSDG